MNLHIECPPGVGEKVCCETKHTVGEEAPEYDWRLNTECPGKEQPISVSYKIVSDNYCEKKELECVKCGDDCFKKIGDDVPFCGETTKEFDCVEKNNECVVANLKEGLNCGKCGDGCFPGKELEVMYCEKPSKDFDCVEEDDKCVVLEKEMDDLIIKIIDNGKGIPENILPKIKKGRISIDKQGGSGLGISGAIQNIKKWK